MAEFLKFMKEIVETYFPDQKWNYMTYSCMN